MNTLANMAGLLIAGWMLGGLGDVVEDKSRFPSMTRTIGAIAAYLGMVVAFAAAAFIGVTA